MLFTERVFIGIGTTGGRKPFFYAALDEEGRLLAADEAEQEEMLAFLLAQEQVVVAINAPQSPNRGLVRARMEAESLDKKVRGADLRLAEAELRARGIQVGKTPGRPELCPAWMRVGFGLYQKLDAAGFAPYPAGEASRVRLETHPHAVFCVLLGRRPLPRPTLLGKMQRQLALVNHGLGVRDPMDFFEEVTRHRLLKADLPFDWIYEAEMLDALAAALTAWQTVRQPADLLLVGDAEEGQIALPTATLRPNYGA